MDVRLGLLRLSEDGRLAVATDPGDGYDLIVVDLGPIADVERWQVPASERLHFDTLADLARDPDREDYQGDARHTYESNQMRSIG